jgi:fucose permease
MTGKRIALLIACAGLICAYQYALVWGIRHALALPIPSAWLSVFPTRISGTLTWAVLIHIVAILIVSVPFALLIARFGGPRAPVVALAITVILFFVFWLPPLIQHFGITPSRTLVVSAFDYLKLFLVLPILVWLVRKLPSNNRWSGP